MISDLENRGSVPATVLVITRNEETNIAQCLESVRWAGEFSWLIP